MAFVEALEHKWIIMGKTVASSGIGVGSHAALLIPLPDSSVRPEYGRYLSKYMSGNQSWVSFC